MVWYQVSLEKFKHKLFSYNKEMPYIIKKVKTGFKVCKKDEPKVCFSKRGLPLKRAKKQRVAIILSEAGRKKK